MIPPPLTPGEARPSPLRPGSEPAVLGEGRSGRLFKTRGPLDPVNDQAIFVDRPECAQLVALARGGTVDHYIALLAPRQSGKTSLLYKTRHELLKQNNPVAASDAGRSGPALLIAFVDLQGLGVEDESSAYGYVAEQIVCEWQRDPRFDATGLPKVTNGPSFRQFLLQAAERQRATRLMILLDEVGAFPARLADGFFGTIRNVFSNRHKSSEEAFAKYLFIFSGAIDLHTLTSGVNSPLNICDKIFLRDLTASGVRHLTDLLATRGTPCPTDVSEYIYDRTGGHPYLTQRICSLLEQQVEGTIARARVDSAIAEIMQGDDNLNHVTRHLDQDDEAKELTQRIVVSGEKIPFSRVNPSVGRLETIGVIREANGVCKVRNNIYLRALRVYFGVSKISTLPVVTWTKSLLPLLGLVLLIAFLPTALVYLRDVAFAPPSVLHTVDLQKPGVQVTVNHDTVIKDLVETPILISLKRDVPMSAITVTITSDDPEIVLVDKTRFMVMRGDDERKDFKIRLSRLNYLPNILNPFDGRRTVRLNFITPDGKNVESQEVFHNDILQAFGLGTIAGTAVGIVMALSQIVTYVEVARGLPRRVRTVLGREQRGK